MPLVVDDYLPKFPYRNGHANTIFSHVVRQKQAVTFIRERLELDDGDFLDIDLLQSNADKAIILFHGLEGSSASSYMQTFAHALSKHNFDIVAVNYRGCSGSLNRKLTMYHSGFTEDVNVVVSKYANLYKSINLIGFSLGGNLVLKYLGENKFDIPFNLHSAISISAPTDLEACSLEIIKSKNWIY